MSDSLLDRLYSHKVTQSSKPPPKAPPAGPPDGPRARISASSFERWHFAEAPSQEEDHWMMTYLDVVTLLLMMMVVMLAFANPLSGPSKAKAAAAAAAQAAVPDPSNILPPLPLPVPRTSKPSSGDSTADEGQKKSSSELSDLGDGIEVIRNPRSVSFRINTEVMFAAGDTTLTPAGQAMVDRLLPVLNKVPDHTIVVGGHTDNIPIQTTRFPSNWELAAGRAASVVRQLESRGINPTRLMAVGYGDTHPLQSNLSPEGRLANRRVEVTMEAPANARP